jgi:hypothetical protein
MDKPYPEGFEPLVVIGEVDGYLMVFTAESNEVTQDLLENALYILSEEPDEAVVLKH